MNEALGIVNFEDNSVEISGLTDYRTVSAISFLGRYRLIDFVISNMTNSGISHIQVYFKNKPRSLIEHLGTGRHYNLNSKRGRLHLLGGEEVVHSEVYNHDINAFQQNLEFIEEDSRPYVVIAPSYMIYSIDYNYVLEAHKQSNADITVVYKPVDNATEYFVGCDTITFDGGKHISKFEKNRGKYKTRNISLECYVMTKKIFIELINRAARTSSLFGLKDILADSVNDYNILGYAYRGYVACVNSLAQYYKANMELCDYHKAAELFQEDWTIHTRTNDSPPTLYGEHSHVKGSSIANGCTIEGEVINSVVGRNVVIKKGAIVKNSIILPDCFIGENVKLDGAVVDKKAIVHHVKKLEGTKEEPIYVKKRDRI